MFYSTFTAATLLASIAGNANAAVAAERSLDPVAFKAMDPHPHPHYVDNKPADESSEMNLQEVESWFWGGG
jgi:hypothetical protein